VRDVAKRLEILSGMKINVLPHFQQEYLVYFKRKTQRFAVNDKPVRTCERPKCGSLKRYTFEGHVSAETI
jgi:hypothetical protein